ncbi:hypothetical protein MAUB1S_05176 [Mycolicibacterium aubagnense]
MVVHAEVLHLEAVLAKVHPDFLGALAPGATTAQLDELEGVVGQPLPAILRDLLSWRNGVSAEAAMVRIDGPWELMSVAQICEEVAMMRDLLRSEPGWIERTWWSTDWVPFLHDFCGDFICVDLTGDAHTLRRNGQPYQGIPGQIINFDHEAEWRTVQAPSLQTWLTAVAEIIDASLVTPTSWPLGERMAYEFDEPDDQSPLDDALTRLAPGYPIHLDCPS